MTPWYARRDVITTANILAMIIAANCIRTDVGQQEWLRVCFEITLFLWAAVTLVWARLKAPVA
ncbi:MAG TPA: hypothetical protein VJJ48_00565 [Candidatus Paceibacterota bacterium]